MKMQPDFCQPEGVAPKSINHTKISGLYIIENFMHSDLRGSFVKTFGNSLCIKELADFKIREQFFSVSHKNVIRGMHFQNPPYEHSKLVFVINGEVDDVVLDIRKGSATYGKFEVINLKPLEKSIYVPIGCAHGFLSKEDNTIMFYNQSSEYIKVCDSGVKYDSFGYNWQIDNPILSIRDLSFPDLHQFESPFGK